MKTYTAKFTGRTKGAIGVFHGITTTVEGENQEAARLALYDNFEHITGLELTEEPRLYYRNGKTYLTPPPEGAPRCFRIIRFFKSGRKPRTIKQSLTESEAQAHCSKESTHGDDWFDGYDYMKGCRP